MFSKDEFMKTSCSAVITHLLTITVTAACFPHVSGGARLFKEEPFRFEKVEMETIV